MVSVLYVQWNVILFQCDVDLAAVAYAYVYFEKLVLMASFKYTIDCVCLYNGYTDPPNTHTHTHTHTHHTHTHT